MLKRRPDLLLLLALAIVVVSATGCMVASKTPLSDEKTSVPDMRLLGTWKETSRKPAVAADGKQIVGQPDSNFRLTIRRKKEHENVLQAVLYDDSTKKSGVFDLFTTKIAEDSYASVAVPETSREFNYLICKYEIREKDSLDIWHMDRDFIKSAINNKLIRGDGLNIQETPEGLRKFIEEHGAKCFEKEPGVSRRVLTSTK